MMNVSLSGTLEYLLKHDYDDLSFFLRSTWDAHPPQSDDGHYQMWKEQVALNLPVLYLASMRLHNFVKSRGIKHLLFATRDCSHWYKIHKVLYPGDDSHYFDCSRNMLNKARITYNADYERYVNRVTNKDIKHTVFIDIHGTGTRMYDYFLARHQEVPTCFILSSGRSSSSGLLDGIQQLIKKQRCEFLIFGAAGSPIEMLNYDVIGTCNDYVKYGPVRAAVEYDIKYVLPYHNCVNTFIELIKKHPAKVIDHKSNGKLLTTIKHLFEPALDDLPVISRWIDAERKHRLTDTKI